MDASCEILSSEEEEEEAARELLLTSKVVFARGMRVASSAEVGAMSGTVPSSLMGVRAVVEEDGDTEDGKRLGEEEE